MTNPPEAQSIANAIVTRLVQLSNTKVVLAESCTAGLAAAYLGQVPGVSKWFCGSAVTYRESLKQQWLDVSSETLDQHTAESLATTQAMAIGALQNCDEATIAAAITGHLGPAADTQSDGWIFIAVAKRTSQQIQVIFEQADRLTTQTRLDRQSEAAQLLLKSLYECLSDK